MARLKSDLSRIARNITDDAARAALLKTGADVATLAKQLAPVDTGALRTSIGAEPVDKYTVRVGSDKDYAVYQEYGTSRMSAQPFLTPAFTQAESSFTHHLKEECDRVIR